MIVCVCNRLNEAKIRAAIACGVVCSDEVYAHHGVRKNCGRCQETIKTMLDAAESQREPVLQAAE